MRQVPSPNHGPRRGGIATPDLIVLHYTAMRGGAEPAIRHLCDPAAQVSCHYVIDEGGGVTQLVQDEHRAWHAGAGRWGGSDDVNSRSLGIELSNDATSPFPAPQMDALDYLLETCMARHGIAPAGVIGHSDCAPGRKVDPGPRFDWRRLGLRGLAALPEARLHFPPDAAGFAADLARAGYTAEADAGTLLAAFRLRTRPGAHGPLDGADMALAADFAARYPAH